MIMAGGRGRRLGALTCHRSKPAVPFGGRYRIIDFVLSNFVNSGYRRIFVLTQFMASSLIKHLNRNWRLSGIGEFIEVVPPQMRMGDFWYRGTADSVYQNLNLIRDERAEHVAVFGGDHIYNFNIADMDQRHRDSCADLTVAALPVRTSEANRFGIIAVDETGRITGFLEKPENPPEIPGRPGWSLASMGNYIFRADVLVEALEGPMHAKGTRYDFGGDVVPGLVKSGAHVMVYDFGTNRIPGESPGTMPYWRDVGTIDSYFEANMDLRARMPELNVYNRRWRIHAAQRAYPPARLVRHGPKGASSVVDDSMVCEGAIVASARLNEVLLGYDCFVHAGAEIEDSVILSGCNIGARAHLRRVLLDKNCMIDPGVVIGHDPKEDAERFPFITDSGIVVLPKGTYVPRRGPMQIAHDIDAMLRNDELTREPLERLADAIEVSDTDRHSYLSAGPRYERFAPGLDETDSLGPAEAATSSSSSSSSSSAKTQASPSSKSGNGVGTESTT